jgi:hypothetical protein
VQDLAQAENVTITFVSRMTRLAYLSPDVLDRLVVWRVPPARSASKP